MRKKFIIGGLVLLIAFGFLLYTLIDNSLSYYVTVSELLADGSNKYGDNVRVNGTVKEGSIEWDPGIPELKFTLADEQATLPVIYHGAIPHDLTDGKDIVVNGKYTSEGILQASKLVMKCASKYEAAD